MDELLNKLIEKGRKPFGIAYYCSFDVREEIKILLWPFWWWEYLLHRTLSLRELVSKESDLWQFVCEHWMIKTYMNIEHESRRHSDKKHTPIWAFDNQSYYYIIESALKDESELEQFLLDNIKIEWNDL